jgi:hypothetical protein
MIPRFCSDNSTTSPGKASQDGHRRQLQRFVLSNGNADMKDIFGDIVLFQLYSTEKKQKNIPNDIPLQCHYIFIFDLY